MDSLPHVQSQAWVGEGSSVRVFIDHAMLILSAQCNDRSVGSRPNPLANSSKVSSIAVTDLIPLCVPFFFSRSEHL